MSSRSLLLVLVALSAGLGGEVRAESTDFVLPSGEVFRGEKLAELRALPTQASRVRAAVRDAFGLEIGEVPIHVVTLQEIRDLHEVLGGRMRPGWQLHGFELEGHVFVRRELGGVSDEVLIHECLHALSQRFAAETKSRGVDRIVEGVTQHLALRAMAARPHTAGLRVEKNRTYVASTGFAEALEMLVGAEVLRAAYFGAGLRALEERVDRVRHGRHVFIRAAHALDEGNERAALSLLTGAP